MSSSGYLIWFVGTAVCVASLLTIGVLIAAGIIGPKERPTSERVAGPETEEALPRTT